MQNEFLSQSQKSKTIWFDICEFLSTTISAIFDHYYQSQIHEFSTL